MSNAPSRRTAPPTPGKRTPLSPLELNGIKQPNLRTDYIASSTPKVVPWVFITPDRITGRSPPYPGKENVPPHLVPDSAFKGIDCLDIWGSEVASESNSLAMKLQTSGFKCLLNPGYRSKRTQDAEAFGIYEDTPDRCVSEKEYLSKDHISPLGVRDITAPMRQKKVLGQNASGRRLFGTLLVGENGCTPVEVPGASSLPTNTPIVLSTGNHFAKKVNTTHAPEEAEIPMYKLISPAGICLPLDTGHRRGVIRNAVATSASAPLEASRDIVRFRPSQIPTPSVEKAVEAEPKKLQSKIPLPPGERKMLSLPKSKRYLSNVRGTRRSLEVAAKVPAQPLTLAQDKGELITKTETVSIPSSLCPPDDIDPFLLLYLFERRHNPYLQRSSSSRPLGPVRSAPLSRTSSLPTQASSLANTNTRSSSRKTTEGRCEEQKTAEIEANQRKLFDMGPPPSTPVEEREMMYYGSRYYWWRGMRV